MIGYFFIGTVSRPAVGLIQSPIQWVQEVKRPRREANELYPSRAEVKNAWNYNSTPPIHLYGVMIN